MENKVISYNSEKAMTATATAFNALSGIAQIENINDQTTADIVMRTAYKFADKIEFIRAKVCERVQEKALFDKKYKNVVEWAKAVHDIQKSTLYKAIDSAKLIDIDGLHTIAHKKENGEMDFTYTQIKIFAEKVKPLAKEKASRISKMSAKEKKTFFGDMYEAFKNASVSDMTIAFMQAMFKEWADNGDIMPDMPYKKYIAILDQKTGKAIIDDTPAESTAENTAENTTEKAKSVKLTAEEWTAIVNLCNRIKNGEEVKELPADVVKVLTAHN